MYSGLSGDHVTTVDEKNIILIKMLNEDDVLALPKGEQLLKLCLKFKIIR